MSYIFDSRLGEQLYNLLPEVYRTRDKLTAYSSGVSGTEDLAKYLDAHGYLLDLIYATLQQQLQDVLPKVSQDWLLPYFAQLLAANLLSPESEGKHAEVDNAIAWRQRKGTLKCAEDIAQAIGQMEVEVQEGWKRVAMTPRVGDSLIPATAWDNTLNIDLDIPSQAIKHPGLPAATVDLRYPSRAIKTDATNPSAKVTRVAGIKDTWRQANSHGTPCFPGSFEDISRRTVDLRIGTEQYGYYHHKRLLLFVPPPTGMFPLAPIKISWSDALARGLISETLEAGFTIYSNTTTRILQVFDSDDSNVNDTITLASGYQYKINNIHFLHTLLLTEGNLELKQVQAEKVKVDSFSTDLPVLTAQDCLFDTLSVGNGIAKLDSCTVRTIGFLKSVDINDSIVMDVSEDTLTGAIQYSRIPESINSNIENRTIEDCVSDDPEFFSSETTLEGKSVLGPTAPQSIYSGASDGDEMGYFHYGRKSQPVMVSGDYNLSLLDNGGYTVRDVIFTGNVVVNQGVLNLQRCAAKSLTINTMPLIVDDNEIVPALNAIDCIMNDITVPNYLIRLEYCTVMGTLDCRYLQASDCIFAGTIINVWPADTLIDPPAYFNCVRYSAIPSDLDEDIIDALHLKNSATDSMLGSNTFARPGFVQFEYCDSVEDLTQVFPEPGYGVLHNFTANSIRFGAEDGGEMGAYHHKYYSLKTAAMLDKMREFLPIGIEPVLINDARLLQNLPAQQSSA